MSATTGAGQLPNEADEHLHRVLAALRNCGLMAEVNEVGEAVSAWAWYGGDAIENSYELAKLPECCQALCRALVDADGSVPLFYAVPEEERQRATTGEDS